MTAKAIETEVELLKQGAVLVASDINELKNDVKAIRTFLMGSESEEPKIVTRKEFEDYKTTQNYTKVVVSVVTAVFTSMITWIRFKVLNK